MAAPNDSEAHRRACEARWLAGLPTDAARADYLALVEKHRGAELANRLRRDAWNILRTPRPVPEGSAGA